MIPFKRGHYNAGDEVVLVLERGGYTAALADLASFLHFLERDGGAIYGGVRSAGAMAALEFVSGLSREQIARVSEGRR